MTERKDDDAIDVAIRYPHLEDLPEGATVLLRGLVVGTDEDGRQLVMWPNGAIDAIPQGAVVEVVEPERPS